MIRDASVRPPFARRLAWSGGPLEIGLTEALHVREERLTERRDACRLLYISDIQVGRYSASN